MAKLTRKQVAAVKDALYHAQRAQTYLSNKDVAVAIKGKLATTTLHYTRASGETLYEIDKEIGSDLCGLHFCIKALEALLETGDSSIAHGRAPIPGIGR